MGIFNELWYDIQRIGDDNLIELPQLSSFGYMPIYPQTGDISALIQPNDLEVLKQVHSVYTSMHKSPFHRFYLLIEKIPQNEPTFNKSALIRAYCNGFTRGYNSINRTIKHAFQKSGVHLTQQGCIMITNSYISTKVNRYYRHFKNQKMNASFMFDRICWFGQQQGAIARCLEYEIELKNSLLDSSWHHTEQTYTELTTKEESSQSNQARMIHLLAPINATPFKEKSLEELLSPFLIVEDANKRQDIINTIKLCITERTEGNELCSLIWTLHKLNFLSLSNKRMLYSAIIQYYPNIRCSESYFSRALKNASQGISFKAHKYHFDLFSKI